MPALAPPNGSPPTSGRRRAEALAARYEAWASLRDLAAETDWQATRIRRLLIGVGVELRSRAFV